MVLKYDLEKLIIAVLFTLTLFIGPGVFFGHTLKHDFPFGYLASDAFQHQVRAEWIKDAGNFKYEAPYISSGFEHTVGIYPPVIYHIGVVLSHASGLEVYDTLYFVVMFFSSLAIFIMYFVIRSFNKAIALLSLPLSFLIFSFPVSIGFYWGHWPSLLAQSFLILFFWAILKRNLSLSFILIGLSLSSIALTHTSEAVFAIIFVVLFFGIKLSLRKIQLKEIKTLVLGFGLSLVLSFYYLIIFKNTWARETPYSFAIEPIWNGNPGFYITMFGLFLIPIVAGLTFSLLKIKDTPVALIAAFAMLLGGFLNYIGFGLRSFQIRFFWPIYLSVFFGFGFYMLTQIFNKKLRVVSIISILCITSALILGVLPDTINFKDTLRNIDNRNPGNTPLITILSTIPQYNADTNPGMLKMYNGEVSFHWEVFKWIQERTPPNAIIYFFYGDIYDQDAILRNTKRIHLLIEPDDNEIKAVQEKRIKREFNTEFAGDEGGGNLVRKSFFRFEEGKPPAGYNLKSRDICEFDYLVFDKFSRQQEFAQYNLLLAQELLKQDYITKVFENPLTIILKNNEPGAECIEENNL